jgi:hypothetical protein
MYVHVIFAHQPLHHVNAVIQCGDVQQRAALAVHAGGEMTNIILVTHNLLHFGIGGTLLNQIDQFPTRSLMLTQLLHQLLGAINVVVALAAVVPSDLEALHLKAERLRYIAK